MSAARPSTVVLVLGTGTEVGKTWLSAALLDEWRGRGLRVAARKPAQSFDVGDDDAGITDAQILGRHSEASPTDVCVEHRWYPVAMAPPIAAEALGLEPFMIGDLVTELTWPDETDIGIVESAGGVRSPLARDGDCLAFGHAVHPDAVVLVADAGLGTINAVTLSLEALARVAGPDVQVLVYLNRFDDGDDLHRRNRQWLAERLGITVVVDPAELATVLGGPRPE